MGGEAFKCADYRPCANSKYCHSGYKPRVIVIWPRRRCWGGCRHVSGLRRRQVGGGILAPSSPALRETCQPLLRSDDCDRRRAKRREATRSEIRLGGSVATRSISLSRRQIVSPPLPGKCQPLERSIRCHSWRISNRCRRSRKWLHSHRCNRLARSRIAKQEYQPRPTGRMGVSLRYSLNGPCNSPS